jgi:hypothetical protein
MYAAVLRTIGSAPRCEEFSEPVVCDKMLKRLCMFTPRR